MRIWTLHPKYLDPRGLVALWRETLLAQKVLQGDTKGYKSHPQLLRFRAQSNPVDAIARYLTSIHDNAVERGYHFDASKISPYKTAIKIIETDGQLLYEWQHLKTKLQLRHPEQYARLSQIVAPDPHPMFTIISGEIRDWEHIIKPLSSHATVP